MILTEANVKLQTLIDIMYYVKLYSMENVLNMQVN